MITKEKLVVGETLVHDFLGECVYTQACQKSEEEYGEKDALFVSVNGEIKLVTLALLERRKNKNDNTLRINHHEPGSIRFPKGR
jgi:hypothetical protein